VAVTTHPDTAPAENLIRTGLNFQVVTDAFGQVITISRPIEGCAHDMRALEESALKELLALADAVFADKGYKGSGYFIPRKKPAGGELTYAQKQYNAQISATRAPVERAIANLKTWRVLHTDYRRPLRTLQDTFHAVIDSTGSSSTGILNTPHSLLRDLAQVAVAGGAARPWRERRDEAGEHLVELLTLAIAVNEGAGEQFSARQAAIARQRDPLFRRRLGSQLAVADIRVLVRGVQAKQPHAAGEHTEVDVEQEARRNACLAFPLRQTDRVELDPLSRARNMRSVHRPAVRSQGTHLGQRHAEGLDDAAERGDAVAAHLRPGAPWAAPRNRCRRGSKPIWISTDSTRPACQRFLVASERFAGPGMARSRASVARGST
jgi:hypothetical protein